MTDPPPPYDGPPPPQDGAPPPPGGYEPPAPQPAPQPAQQPAQQPWAGYGQPGYAPYGVHPGTGIPYSDKSKIIAGLLQILLPLGIGRFYIGDSKTGGWQLAVTLLTCGVGSLWPFIDGIIILVSDSKDAQGRMLRS